MRVESIPLKPVETNLAWSPNRAAWTANTSRLRRVVYQDFSTIDWAYDLAKERSRVMKIGRMTGLWGVYEQLLESVQSWILLTLVGSSSLKQDTLSGILLAL